MIKLKTAVLIGFSLELGGIIGSSSTRTSKALYNIGEYMGMAFQLKDDYLDVFGSDRFGKKIGGDIILNKKTYLLIKLIEKAEKDDLSKIDYWIENVKEPDKKVKNITNMMKRNNIDVITEKKINTYFNKGFQLLDNLSSEGFDTKLLRNYFAMIMKRKV